MTPPAEPSPTSLVREILSSKTERALEALEARSCHSWRLGLDRTKVLPKAMDVIGVPSINLFTQSSNGAYVTDVDRTRFLDLCMGYGALIIGHAHPRVQKAITDQASHGWQLGLPNADQTELAQLIQAAGPANERVVLCNSGQDANILAARAACLSSGKGLVGVLAGAAHGSPSGDHVNDNAKTKLRAGPNVFSAEDYRTIAFPYGHTGTFDLIRRRKHELAAIIVDPARKGEASAAHVEWLHQLYKTCSESDVLLILDETITGFRVKYGGMQELFGLLPDLVTYGGVIGGGLSLGAVAGRADIIKSLHSPSADISGSLGNTHVGNPLSIAAGVATLGYLRNNRATLYPELNAQSEEWVKNFNAFVAREHMPVEMKNIGSMFRIFFVEMPP